VGRGSFADVYLGTVTGEPAAIKCQPKRKLILQNQADFGPGSPGDVKRP
jgi:hypothetical protein